MEIRLNFLVKSSPEPDRQTKEPGRVTSSIFGGNNVSIASAALCACVYVVAYVFDVQFPEVAFSGLRDSLLLFVHDQTDPNVLQLLTSASQLYDGVLVEVVLSGNRPAGVLSCK